MGSRIGAAMAVRPDWTMLGVRHGERYVIYASNRLSSAELAMTIDDYDFGAWGGIESSHQKFEIYCHMHEIVLAEGADYVEALAILLRMWSPDQGEPVALRSMRAIGDGT